MKYGTDIFDANFVHSKKLTFFINRYIPQLMFSSKICDLNLVKEKIEWLQQKKRYET